MRFLLDAQLPKRLAIIFAEAGHDVIHTSSLPLGNRTPDKDLIGIAERDQRVIVTKDRDFEFSHLVRGEPSKLLLDTTGNMTNRDLAAVLAESLATIAEAFIHVGYVELTPSSVVIRHDSQSS